MLLWENAPTRCPEHGDGIWEGQTNSHLLFFDPYLEPAVRRQSRDWYLSLRRPRREPGLRLRATSYCRRQSLNTELQWRPLPRRPPHKPCPARSRAGGRPPVCRQPCPRGGLRGRSLAPSKLIVRVMRLRPGGEVGRRVPLDTGHCPALLQCKSQWLQWPSRPGAAL